MITAALVALAIGAAFGRWQVLPVQGAPPGTPFGDGSAAMVVPAPALSLRAGDIVFVSVGGERGSFRRVVAVVDSWQRQYELEGEGGIRNIAELSPSVWRVARAVPSVGVVLDLLVGSVQSVLLVVVGLVLIAWAEVRRSRDPSGDVSRTSRASAPEVTHVQAVATTQRITHWLTPRRRMALMSAVLASGALVSWYHASASYTATSAPSHATATGDMELTLGTEGSADNRLTIGSTLSPGDSAYRQVKLTVANVDGAMDEVTLTTSASNGPPAFVTDATHGLKLWIARCSAAWTESGSHPDFDYTCDGPATEHDVLGTSASPVPVLQSDAALANLVLGAGATNHLVVRLTFPATAPGSMVGDSSDISFSFEGQQRDADDR